ncbi:MAG TPA: exosortase/archaeosortase family protein [Candidatus Angelobacter sp.]|jgi:exosortase|nr:exosortase/archaeosortase family protein [Candidatus Angelobacter sp.]
MNAAFRADRRDVTGAAGDGPAAPPLWRSLRAATVSERNQLALRAVLVVALIALAYQYSLVTLLRGMALESPLAYLGLIPLISLALVVVRALSATAQPDVHDRYLDYLIGLPPLLTAVAIVELTPARLSSFFWLWRLDLLSLPFFVAGAVTLVFGTRALWRMRFPIALLFLAWPLPYSVLLVQHLQTLTALTARTVGAALRFFPVATPYPSDDGSLFMVTHQQSSFVISVASPCSGANSMIGFLLVGAAVLGQIRGSRWRKLGWLATGIALMWVADVVRVLLIFGAGARFGERVALDTLHPVVGLIFVCAVALLMVRLIPVFGLRLVAPQLRRRWRAWREGRGPRRPAVHRARTALVIVTAAAGLTMATNLGLQRYQLLAEDLGPPRLALADVARASVSGWTISWKDHYPWATQYFGSEATWDRYLYAPKPVLAQAPAGAQPVFLDLISTSDLLTFSTYGLDDCYRFHNYDVVASDTVDLGGGLTGHQVTYHIRSDDTAWTAVYWEWPVRTVGGDRYERIILSATTAYRDSGAASATRQQMRVFAENVVTASAQLTRAAPGAGNA